MNPTPIRPPGGARLLVQIAASGCIRTRKDAEDLRDAILKGGYEVEYITLYRAVLALLGDASAMNLPEPQYRVAMAVYLKMKKSYIGDSECRCLRNATGGVMVKLTSCPVHGDSPEARPGLRNLTGLKR
jgi:hypothetical protein